MSSSKDGAKAQELSAQEKRELRLVVETYYDVQDIRMSTDNRIRQYADHEALVAVEGEAAAQRLRDEGQEAYKKAIRVLKKEAKDLVFLDAYEKALAGLEDDDHHAKVNKLMSQQETILKRKAEKLVSTHPLWTSWLIDVKGIGPCLSGGLLSWINIERCRYASQLWKYSGLAVITDSWKCHACGHTMDHHPSLLQRGVRASALCPKCQNPMAAIGHADRRQKGKVLGYNPNVKKLFWKIGNSFVKLSPATSKYRALYDKFRAQVEAKILANKGFCSKTHYSDGEKKTKVIPCFDAHKFAMAKRLTVKVFAAHIYLKWREILGLQVDSPWIFWDGSGHQDFIAPFSDKEDEKKKNVG